MTGFGWESFVRDESESAYFKFSKVGDTISGTITGIAVTEFDGKKSPELTLDVDGDEKFVTASQKFLQSQLAELAPQVGQHITITFTESRPTGRPQPMKVFTVVVAEEPQKAETAVVESKAKAPF